MQTTYIVGLMYGSTLLVLTMQCTMPVELSKLLYIIITQTMNGVNNQCHGAVYQFRDGRTWLVLHKRLVCPNQSAVTVVMYIFVYYYHHAPSSLVVSSNCVSNELHKM